jgi:hypothetical protein
MKEVVVERKENKASIATNHVNSIIDRMISYSGVDEFSGLYRNYAYLCVLGYNDNVYPLLSRFPTPVDIATLADNPLGRVPIYQEVSKDGNIQQQLVRKQTIWVEPKAEGNTQMVYALERAKNVVERWLQSPSEFISKDMGMQEPRQDCFPPVVINITDAKHNGEGSPEDIAEEIRSLRTVNGNVLLCNCHFTHEKYKPCLFPTDVNQIDQVEHRKLVHQMFQMSSVIPEELRERASKDMGLDIQRGARCFVYNANPDQLLRFLSWGTLGNAGIGGR